MPGSCPLPLPFPRFDRLLLTGACRRTGPRAAALPAFACAARCACRTSPPRRTAQPNEESVGCDVGDRAAVMELMRDVDAVAHFGGVSVEDRFDRFLHANIAGAFNLYEAARKLGVRRIVYASSSQVTGFYPTDRSSTRRCRSARRASTGCRSASARTCRGCSSTATASRRSACASRWRSREPSDAPHAARVPVVRTTCASSWSVARSSRATSATRSSTACPPTATSCGDNPERGEDRLDADATAPSRSARRSRRRTPVPDPHDVQNRFHGGKFTQDGPFEDRPA